MEFIFQKKQCKLSPFAKRSLSPPKLFQALNSVVFSNIFSGQSLFDVDANVCHLNLSGFSQYSFMALFYSLLAKQKCSLPFLTIKHSSGNPFTCSASWKLASCICLTWHIGLAFLYLGSWHLILGNSIFPSRQGLT